ncbi:MAG: hypothetical protein ABL927_09280 [Bdellovibrionales bacterium]
MKAINLLIGFALVLSASTSFSCSDNKDRNAKSKATAQTIAAKAVGASGSKSKK